MDLLYYFRKLYSLDTLDTRFVISSTTPPRQPATELREQNGRAASAESSKTSKRDAVPGTQSSKWNTPEFYLYYLVFLIAVPSMFKVAIEVSQRMSICYQMTTANFLQHLTQIIPSSSHCSLQDGYLVGKSYVSFPMTLGFSLTRDGRTILTSSMPHFETIFHICSSFLSCIRCCVDCTIHSGAVMHIPVLELQAIETASATA